MSDAPKPNAFPSSDANRLALDLDELERQLRQLSGKPSGQAAPDDPMAELARLVGRDDPIRALLQGTPAGAAPQAVPVEDHRQTYAAPEAQAFDPYAPVEGERRFAGSDDFSPYSASERGYAPVAASEPEPDQAAQQFSAHHPADRYVPDEQDYPTLPAHYDSSPEDYPPGYHVPPGDEAELVALDNRKSRRGLMTATALVAVAVAAVAGALTLRDSGPAAPSGAAPVITADPGPSRVVPQNPGGVEIPNQNKQIYEQPNQSVPDATRVVNREEQPVDVRQTARALAQRDSIDGLIGATGAASTNPPRPAGANDANALAALGEPKRVRTVAVRPDGTIVGDQGAATVSTAGLAAAGAPLRTASAGPLTLPPGANQQARPNAVPPTAATAPAAPVAANPPPASAATTTASPAPRPPAAQTSAATPAPAQATPPAGSGPLSISPNAASQQKLQQRVATAPVAAPADTTAATPRAAAPAAGGDFMVQLAARPSERDALDAFAQLQRRYTDLSGFSPVVRRAEVGDKTIYRLRVGSMSRDEATSLCSKLQASGGQCFVARN